MTAWMPTLARAASNDSVNWPARSRTRNRKSAARSPRSTSRLRICWVVHGPSRCAVTPEDVHVAGADLDHEEAVQAPQGHGAVYVEEVGCEHGRGLGMQELPPGRVRVPVGAGVCPERKEGPM